MVTDIFEEFPVVERAYTENVPKPVCRRLLLLIPVITLLHQHRLMVAERGRILETLL
jgi:hypothetical protein